MSKNRYLLYQSKKNDASGIRVIGIYDSELIVTRVRAQLEEHPESDAQYYVTSIPATTPYDVNYCYEAVFSEQGCITAINLLFAYLNNGTERPTSHYEYPRDGVRATVRTTAHDVCEALDKITTYLVEKEIH